MSRERIKKLVNYLNENLKQHGFRLIETFDDVNDSELEASLLYINKDIEILHNNNTLPMYNTSSVVNRIRTLKFFFENLLHGVHKDPAQVLRRETNERDRCGKLALEKLIRDCMKENDDYVDTFLCKELVSGPVL